MGRSMVVISVFSGAVGNFSSTVVLHAMRVSHGSLDGIVKLMTEVYK